MLSDDFGATVSAPGLARTIWVVLLLATTVGLSYGAEPSDSRLVEAAKNQDQKAVRTLLTHQN